MTAAAIAVLSAVLLLAGVGLSVAAAALMARGFLRPPRMTDGKAAVRLRRLTPGDLGMPFESVAFDVRSGPGCIRLAAWWIPLPGATKTVVLLHGFADAKVGAIAWGPVVRTSPVNLLVIDLRAHGESGGDFCTGGYFERDDIDQVVDRLMVDRPGQARRVYLFGVSFGSAVAAAVAAGRADLAGVILESPFVDFKRAIRAHARLLGLPGGWVVTLAIQFAQWRTGARFDAVRPVDLIPAIRCPVLAIVGRKDAMLSGQDVEQLRAAVGPNRFEVFEGAGHLRAMESDPVRYAAVLSAFLGED